MKSTNHTPLTTCLIVVFIHLFCFQIGTAQYKGYFIGDGEPRLKKIEAKAQEATDSSDYLNAYLFYAQALEVDSNKLINRYLLAESARKYSAYCIGKDAFEQLIVKDTANQYPDAKYRFAEMEKLSSRYSKADSILASINDPNLTIAVQKEIRDIEFIEEYQNKPLPAVLTTITKLAINTEDSEINPVWRKGALYYGSLAYAKAKDKRQYAKTLVSDLISSGEEWPNFNEQEKSTTHLSFTPDDSRVYFTICDYGKQQAIICQIYYKDKISNEPEVWSDKKRIKLVNAKGTTSTHPSYGLNGKGQPVLYFASNRTDTGEKGDMNIWYSKIEGDDFGLPRKLGSNINTLYNEITPFYHFESNTLYFGSDGHPGFGGYDIHRIPLNTNGAWETVENLGKPINSEADDFNYFLKQKADTGFFVSNRDGCDLPPELVPCRDIYEVILPCQTIATICVYEEVTNIPIEGTRLNLDNGLVATSSNKIEKHCFLYENLSSVNKIAVHAAHKDYLPADTTFYIEQCKENAFDLFLRKPLCEPLLTVRVTGKQLDQSVIALNNASVILIPNTPVETHIGNTFTFKVEPKVAYQLIVEHNKFLPSSDVISINGCDSVPLDITLVPIIIEPLDSSIVCYFEHDIPKIIGNPLTSASPYNSYVPRLSVIENEREFRRNKSYPRNTFYPMVEENYTRLKNYRTSIHDNLRQDPTASYSLQIRGFCSTPASPSYNKKLANRRVDSVRKFFLENLESEFASRLIFDPVPIGEVENPNSYECDQRRVEVERIDRITTPIRTSDE